MELSFEMKGHADNLIKLQNTQNYNVRDNQLNSAFLEIPLLSTNLLKEQFCLRAKH